MFRQRLWHDFVDRVIYGAGDSAKSRNDYSQRDISRKSNSEGNSDGIDQQFAGCRHGVTGQHPTKCWCPAAVYFDGDRYREHCGCVGSRRLRLCGIRMWDDYDGRPIHCTVHFTQSGHSVCYCNIPGRHNEVKYRNRDPCYAHRIELIADLRTNCGGRLSTVHC